MKNEPANQKHKSDSSRAGIRKVSGGRMTLGVMIMALVLADLVCLWAFATNSFFTVSERLMYLLSLDKISLMLIKLTDLRVIVTFALSFIVGGLLVLLVARLAESLLQGGVLGFRRRHIVYSVLIFFVFSLIMSCIALFCGQSAFDYGAYKYLAPCIMYLGGLIFYGISCSRREAY